MAFSMKLQVASALIVAVMFALYSANGVSCQDGESSADKSAPEAAGAAAATNKIPSSGLPMIVVRQGGSGGGKPDMWLGWLNWEGLSFIKPISGPFVQQIQPFSQEMSGMLLNLIPGASSIYTQFDQMGNQLSQLNPMSQFLGGSGSGSGSGLSGLSGLFGSGSGSGSGLGGLFGGRR